MNVIHNAVFDPTLNDGAGGWRSLRTTDLGGGGGGGGGDASAANQLALKAVIGSTSDAAWDGVAANPTMMAVLKMIAINTQEVVVV
mgnify:CR=1 FL=1